MSLADITRLGRRGNVERHVLRQGAPTLDDDGVWQPGAVVDLGATPMGFWPAEPNMLVPLPEGVRISDVRDVHAGIALRVDDVVVDGADHFRIYEVSWYRDARGTQLWAARAARQEVP